MGKKVIHAHKMIFQTAEEMAHALYDELMQKNDWYANWKNQHPGMGAKGLENSFVKKVAPTLIEQARATLAAMLTRPIDEGLKEQILEALILDNTLKRGRAEPKYMM